MAAFIFNTVQPILYGIAEADEQISCLRSQLQGDVIEIIDVARQFLFVAGNTLAAISITGKVPLDDHPLVKIRLMNSAPVIAQALTGQKERTDRGDVIQDADWARDAVRPGCFVNQSAELACPICATKIPADIAARVYEVADIARGYMAGMRLRITPLSNPEGPIKCPSCGAPPKPKFSISADTQCDSDTLSVTAGFESLATQETVQAISQLIQSFRRLTESVVELQFVLKFMYNDTVPVVSGSIQAASILLESIANGTYQRSTLLTVGQYADHSTLKSIGKFIDDNSKYVKPPAAPVCS